MPPKKEKINYGPIVISPRQLNMFPDYAITIPTPERPYEKTLDKEPVYRHIAKLILEWDGNGEFEDYVKTTKKVFSHGHFHEDAYVLAKAYERAGFQPDFELVQILDEVREVVYLELKIQIQNWVNKYEVKSVFNISDIVHYINYENVIGTVYAVYHDLAEISVKWEANGNITTHCAQELFKLKQQ